MTIQNQLTLKPKARGFHLITDEVLSHVPEIREIKTGVAHVFIMHTSASLTLNENADPTVRQDFETSFNRIVPEDEDYVHDYEGSDDMPAHIKSSLLGSSVSFPVKDGKPLLGTWQGIYLCEHRNHGGARKVVVTVMGES